MKKPKTIAAVAEAAPASSPIPLVVPFVVLPVLLGIGALLTGRATFGLSQWGVMPLWLWGGIAVLYYIILAVALRKKVKPYKGRAGGGSSNRVMSYAIWLVVGLGLGALFFVFRSQSYFYGDGYMVTAKAFAPVFSSVSGDEAVKLLTVLMYRLTLAVAGSSFLSRPEIPLAAMSSIGGLIALAGLVRLSWKLGPSQPTRIFILLTSLTSACLMLWFGWIEHYTWAMASLLWALYFSVTYFQGEGAYWRAVVAWCVAAGFALTLAPLLLLFLFVSILQKRKRLPSLSRLNLYTALSSLVMAALCYFAIPTLSIVPFIPGTAKPYWALSGGHLLDMLNLLFLVSPIGILLLIANLSGSKKREEAPVGIFLGTAACMLFLISFWIDPTLGAPRDWDLLSLFGIPLTLFAAYMAINSGDSKTVRRLLPVAGLLVVMVVAPNVYEKSHPDLALTRLDGWLWEDPHYQTTYDDARRCISWAALIQSQMPRRANIADRYLWRRLSVVPNDDIVWFNLGEIELSRGKYDSAAVSFEKAYLVWPEKDIYLVRYAQALQGTGSSKLNELMPKLLAIDSDNPKVLGYAGQVLVGARYLPQAMAMFQKAFKMRPWDFRLNVNLALGYHALQQPDSAIYYFRRALPDVPESDRPRVFNALFLEQLMSHHKSDAQATLQEFRAQFPHDTLIPPLERFLREQK